MQGKIIHYETITDEQLSALNKEKTTVFLPISLLEAHGPHLPLGTDFLMAAQLAKALAESLVQQGKAEHVLLLPTVPLGAGGILRTGTLNHGVAVIEQVIVEFGERLSEYGFKKGIVVSGHAGEWHLQAMKDAADVLNEMDIFDFLPLTSFLFSEKGMEKMKRALKKRFKQDPDNALPQYDGHAGCWETSLALVFFPELVRNTYKKLPHSDSAEANGYRGDPSLARVELGVKLKNFLIGTALEIVDEYFLHR